MPALRALEGGRGVDLIGEGVEAGSARWMRNADSASLTSYLLPVTPLMWPTSTPQAKMRVIPGQW